MSSKYRFVTFTVEGGGSFPFDMLRYDACHPDTEQDSHRMEWTGQPGLRQINLKHRILKDEGLTNYPTVDRWRSFNWSVLPQTIERRDY